MKILTQAPKFSECWFCHSKIEGSHTKETEVQYSCRNHPLEVQWYCQRLSCNKWSFQKIDIFAPNHFKLSWNLFIDNKFYLYEWERTTDNKIFGAWQVVFNNSKPKVFSVDWVLLQSPEKLANLLKMYQVFS